MLVKFSATPTKGRGSFKAAIDYQAFDRRDPNRKQAREAETDARDERSEQRAAVSPDDRQDQRAVASRDRRSSDRVAFSYSLNMAGAEREDAIRQMDETARMADTLKAEARVSSKGRKVANPVANFCLNWQSGENPSEAEQRTTVESFLKAMGWQDHEAFVSSHTDTKNPHVHITLNRIHPETGLKLDDAFMKIRAEQWSLDHMRKQGLDHSKGFAERVEKLEEVKQRTRGWKRYAAGGRKASERRGTGKTKGQRDDKRQQTQEAQRKGQQQGRQASGARRKPEAEEDNRQERRRHRDRAKGQTLRPERSQWAELKRRQAGERKALQDAQREAMKGFIEGQRAAAKGLPKQARADVAKEFEEKFAAVEYLPKEQQAAARERLKDEMATRQKIVRDEAQSLRCAEREKQRQEGVKERGELSKLHKEQRGALSKLQAQEYRQANLARAAAGHAAALSNRRGADDPSRYYHRLQRQMAQEQTARQGLQPMRPEDHAALVQQQRAARRAQGQSEVMPATAAPSQPAPTQAEQMEQAGQQITLQRQAFEDSLARSSGLVGRARKAAREMTDRQQGRGQQDAETSARAQAREQSDRQQREANRESEGPAHSQGRGMKPSGM